MNRLPDLSRRDRQICLGEERGICAVNAQLKVSVRNKMAIGVEQKAGTVPAPVSIRLPLLLLFLVLNN